MYEKGKSGNEETQFKKGTSGNPNGRPKKLVNVIKDLPENMQSEVYAILAYALTLKSETEALSYLREQSGKLGKYGFLMQIAIRQLTTERAGWFAAMDIMDRLYGKPRQSAEVTHKADGLTIIVNSQEERDKIETLKDLNI